MIKFVVRVFTATVVLGQLSGLRCEGKTIVLSSSMDAWLARPGACAPVSKAVRD
jgi:hypothetical protein